MAEKKVQPRAARPKKTALVQAVDLLARQAHSTKKLADKLKLRDYEPQEIENAIGILTQRGYLNDEDLCRQQFQRYFTESRCSVRYICCKLMNQGFASDPARCFPDLSAGYPSGQMKKDGAKSRKRRNRSVRK